MILGYEMDKAGGSASGMTAEHHAVYSGIGCERTGIQERGSKNPMEPPVSGIAERSLNHVTGVEESAAKLPRLL